MFASFADTAVAQMLPLASPSRPGVGSALAEQVERDRLIMQLMRRVELLEQRLSAMSGTQGQAAAQPAVRNVPPVQARGTRAASNRSADAMQEQAVMQGQPQGQPQRQLQGQSQRQLQGQLQGQLQDQPQRQLQGQLDESSRALERTLVREGGLVLPSGAFETEARVNYEHRSLNEARLVTVGGMVQLGRETLRRDFAEVSVGLRAGLPAGLQLELSVPYAASWQHAAIAGTREQEQERSGRGNPEIGISKQLWGEAGARPALLGTMRYRQAAEGANFGSVVPVASSFNALQVNFTLVKRRDPLVYFGAITHAYQSSRHLGGIAVDPGNPTSFKLGSILALSPDTSMRLAFELARAPGIRLQGVKLAGSDQTIGLFSAGYAFVLSPRALLGLELGIGLTRDSPDFRFTTWLPIRF